MSKAIVNILKNDSALTTLLGSSDKVRTSFVAQSIKKPYVIVDIEDSTPTNSFSVGSDLDFVRLTISSVSDRAYTNGSNIGATEIADAVRTAIDFVDAGTYNGETIARCTFERSGFMHEDRVANNTQVTKEDEYLVTINRAVIGLPTLLTATLYGYNVIDLAWTDGTAGASDSYEIWRSENGNSFTLLGSTANADSYRDSITSDESRYFNYKVRALTGTDYSLFSNEAGAVTTEVRGQLVLDARDTNALISDGTDNVAILDQSEGLAEVNVYTQDTSAGTDGWADTNLTSSGNNDNISDGITSKDNVLKSILIGGLSQHFITKITLVVGKSYQLTLLAYAPSANALVSTIRLYSGETLEGVNFNVGGSWTLISIKFIAKATSLIVFAKDGGNNDADGDVIYTSDIVINEIQGNHFPQLTVANRGLQGIGEITYDGIAQFNDNVIPSQVATFAAMSTCSIIYINDGTSITQFALNNSSSDYISARVGSSANKALLNVWKTTTLIYNIISDATISIDDVVEWRINANSYQCLINGIEVGFSVTNGSDDGTGFNNLTGVDSLSIGSLQRLNPYFDNTIFKHLFIRSTPNSDTESLLYARGLQVKHNL